MEEHYPVDISIRNVAVRLNDSKPLGSEMNGESITSHSTYSSTEKCTETEVTRFNEACDEKISMTSSDISDEFRDKIHVSCDNTESCGLLNGCNKLLHEDMQCVDFAVNGLIKRNRVERINACIDQLNHRMCVEKPNDSAVNPRTESCVESESGVVVTNDSSNPINVPTPGAVWQVSNNELYLPNLLPLCCGSDVNIKYLGYESESQMPDIMRLIQKDLSEPYSIYTYRYFIHNWPKLCFLAQDGDECVGAIVCKLDVHKKHSRRGYIAMLAVDEKYRKRKIGSNLVLKAINAMVEDNADEVVLETEITNKPALRLYENLGFVRDKRLFRYYLNGVDALRLKLWLR